MYYLSTGKEHEEETEEEKTINNRVRKAINFDLNTKQLKAFYGKKFTSAYYDIQRVFRKHGFEHRQGSGYCSRDQLTRFEVFHIAEDMKRELPWMKDCVKNIDVTDIGRIHSLNYVFECDTELD